MKPIRTCLILILVFLPWMESLGEAKPTDSTVVVNALLEIKEHSTIRDKVGREAKLGASVKTIESSQATAKLAVVCRALACDLNVGDDPAADSYDHVFWECVQKLAKMPQPHRDRALDFILGFSDLQGGDRLRFENITGKPGRVDLLESWCPGSWSWPGRCPGRKPDCEIVF